MKRICLLMPCLVLLPLLSAAAEPDPAVRALPPGATVVVRQQADLNGDGRPEIIVGYTQRGQGGHSAVLALTQGGQYQRWELPGSWAPHYRPRFTVRDVTGDGQPELVQEVAVGGAWEAISIQRWRSGGGWETLLDHVAHSHVLWDANGDGLPEVLGNSKFAAPQDQQTETFRWDGTRYVAWHTAVWSYPDAGRLTAEAVPNVVGQTPAAAEEALQVAGLTLGMIVPIDAAAPPDRILRQHPPAGTRLSATSDRRVHIALGAGSTRFVPGRFPGVGEVLYQSGAAGVGTVPVAQAATRVGPWETWLQSLLQAPRQVVHVHFLPGPAYLFRLYRPWPVSLGGRWELAHWVGVGLNPPQQGLVYLVTDNAPLSQTWFRFGAALYHAGPMLPPPVPPMRSLPAYLRENPATEAFVTLYPAAWAEALRLRGISSAGWPAPDAAPQLKVPKAPDARMVPVPESVLVTVLNGHVERAEQKQGHIRVHLAGEPGRVQRWTLPLTGFTPGLNEAAVHLILPDGKTQTTVIPLRVWQERRDLPSGRYEEGRRT